MFKQYLTKLLDCLEQIKKQLLSWETLMKTFSIKNMQLYDTQKVCSGRHGTHNLEKHVNWPCGGHEEIVCYFTSEL